jgi:hypothetical protein
LGHILALSEVDSPFVGGSADMTARDSFVAVWICSRDPLEGLDGLRDWHRWLIRLWAISCWRLNPAVELSKLVDYFRSAMGGPRALSRLDGVHEIRSPGPWTYYLFLTNFLHQQRETALRWPIRELRTMHTTYAEVVGGSGLWGEEEDALWSDAKGKAREN